ncbi:hypothetical protein AAG906_025807 [Vitis piasezkii]
MAEYAAVPSYMKLDMLRISIKERGLIPGFILQSGSKVYLKCSYGSYKVAGCLPGKYVVLMASIFLTYMAGVIPTEKSYFSSQRNVSDDNAVHESSTFLVDIFSNCSALKNDDQVNLKYAWDVVKGNFDSLDAIEHIGSLENGVVESEQRAKRPLSLHAIADGPRLQRGRSAISFFSGYFSCVCSVVNISENSETVTMDDWLILFLKLFRSCASLYVAWLERSALKIERLIRCDFFPCQALHTLMFEKLEGDTSILQKIRNSGKEDLLWSYCFLRFGSLR